MSEKLGYIVISVTPSVDTITGQMTVMTWRKNNRSVLQ